MFDDTDASALPHQALIPGRIGMLVRLHARPAMRTALLTLLNEYVDGLAEEPGTEFFILSIDPDDENIVWLLEIFRNAEAQEAHRAAGGFHTMTSAMGEVLDQPPGILRFDPIRMSVQQAVLNEELDLG